MKSFKSLIPILFLLLVICTPITVRAEVQGTHAGPSLSIGTGAAFYRAAEFELASDLSPSSNSLRLAPGWADYQPAVSYDFDQWFKSNATTIAIVAVAILLLIVIAD